MADGHTHTHIHYTHMHVHTHTTHTHTHTHTCTHARTHACTHAHAHTHTWQKVKQVSNTNNCVTDALTSTIMPAAKSQCVCVKLCVSRWLTGQTFCGSGPSLVCWISPFFLWFLWIVQCSLVLLAQQLHDTCQSNFPTHPFLKLI